MATVNQVIYDIRESLKKYSDDSELDDRYILYLLNIKRAKYLKQRLDQLNRSYNTNVLQTLCLETELVLVNECGLDFNCEVIVRTKRPIPPLLQLINSNALQRISPSNKLSTKFNIISREKASLYLNSPFSNKIKAFLHNDNYIYLISSDESIKLLECISITGIFENPNDLKNYNNCCNCDDTTDSICYDDDKTEYPVQSDLLDLIRIDVIKELASLNNIVEDKNNNSNDN